MILYSTFIQLLFQFNVTSKQDSSRIFQTRVQKFPALSIYKIDMNEQVDFKS